MDDAKKWVIKSKELDYRCKIATVHTLDCYLPSKEINNKFVSMDMPDWVNIFALTQNHEVIMVKQHRLGANIVTTEVPAGTIDPGETAQNAAARELQEETGYSPKKMILLKSMLVNPAIQSNICSFYLALDCEYNGEVTLDSTEEIDIQLFSLKEIFNARNSALIENSISLLSIMLAKDYLIEKGMYP